MGGFLVLRFISGLFSAVTIGMLLVPREVEGLPSILIPHIPPANFGGTIAGLWDIRDTGLATSVFLWAATVTLSYFSLCQPLQN